MRRQRETLAHLALNGMSLGDPFKAWTSMQKDRASHQAPRRKHLIVTTELMHTLTIYTWPAQIQARQNLQPGQWEVGTKSHI